MTVGMTAPELLIVVFIIALTFFVIVNISVKASKLYARTSVHIEPQASAMIAFKRMEREIRQAMVISTTTPSPSTWVEITLPKKDAQGLNELMVDANNRLLLIPGKRVNYFLGKKIALQDSVRNIWNARPSNTGTTLFRTEGKRDITSNTFPGARVIIDNVINPSDTSLVDEQQLTRDALSNTLFVYSPYDDNGTPDDYTDDRPLTTTNLIGITLIVKSMQNGRPIYHPLWTRFCLRNN
jgi:hypothetical protein